VKYWSINSHHGNCLVEAESPEHAIAIMREHYGRSVTPTLRWGKDDKPICRTTPDPNNCYLASDATWRMSDGAPMLSLGTRFLMAAGATYEEGARLDAGITSLGETTRALSGRNRAVGFRP
jgi:hypothetical protein